ncbi:hypothetical protein ACPXCP_31080 [Streptomyces sp. DT20]|uniref:hypothetical protein n=1 Tax=Streptomyces sp. DT20 TaxID=3416519 RepID=UPI003CF86E40
MNTPISHDPAKVRTADGAVWLRAAVTMTGRGLYALEGVAGCPRYVLATLPELAAYGVQVVVDELVDAVALLGALPMPVGAGEDDDSHEAKVREYLSTPYTDDVGAPAAGELAEQRHLVDELDHVLEHLADDAPAGDRRTESVAQLRRLLTRQSGGAS